MFCWGVLGPFSASISRPSDHWEKQMMREVGAEPTCPKAANFPPASSAISALARVIGGEVEPQLLISMQK